MRCTSPSVMLHIGYTFLVTGKQSITQAEEPVRPVDGTGGGKSSQSTEPQNDYC